MTVHSPDGIVVLGIAGGRVVMTSYPSVDPPVDGVSAPVGSLYLRDTGSASTQLYTKTGAADTAWSAVGGGSGGGVINELWGPRTNPHPADDEFDTNAVDASWSQTGFTALNFGTRPAPYVNPGLNAASWENLRDPDNTTDPSQNSWLRIQPGGGLAGLWKRLDSADFGGAVPADLLAWARFRFAWRNAQAVGGADADIGLSFFEDTGAGFSFAVHATINLNNTQEGTANIIKPLFWGRNGAVVSTITEGTQQNNAGTNRSDYAFYSGYVGLQKNGGDTYLAWLLDDGGRLFMGVYNNAGLVNINAVALWCRGNTLGPMGVPLFDIDFIRFYEGVDWVP